jgi:hypothetical protein
MLFLEKYMLTAGGAILSYLVVKLNMVEILKGSFIEAILPIGNIFLIMFTMFLSVLSIEIHKKFLLDIADSKNAISDNILRYQIKPLALSLKVFGALSLIITLITLSKIT